MRKNLATLLVSLALCGGATAAVIATNARAQVPRKRPLKLVNSLPCHGRDSVELQLAALHVGSQFLELLRVCRVDLGGAHNHGLIH